MHHYGIIDLDIGDVALIKARTLAAVDRADKAVIAAQSDDERAFYSASAVRLRRSLEDFERLVPGRKGFSEKELVNLRGILAEVHPGNLAMRCVTAKRNQDPDLDALEKEYSSWCSLSQKLERPFIDDHSQDAVGDREED
jgi:hypothetical protein|nr:hypothetical protein [Neorhizobium tomejilense]